MHLSILTGMAKTIHVVDRKSNLDTVPANMRPKMAMYHKNPYEEWSGRNDSLPPKSRFYTAPNGSTQKSIDSKPTTDVKVCRHCNETFRKTKCGKCGGKL